MAETQINDGGPAFPIICDDPNVPYEAGMSLRDYFAIHADQPGQLEIASLAGVETSDTCALEWEDPKRRELPRWTVWFNALPQAERMRLYAEVRYQIADAMIKAREGK